MINTYKSMKKVFRVSLVIEKFKHKVEITNSLRVTPEIIRSKNKMTLALILNVYSYHKKYLEKLRDVFITGLVMRSYW